MTNLGEIAVIVRKCPICQKNIETEFKTFCSVACYLKFREESKELNKKYKREYSEYPHGRTAK